MTCLAALAALAGLPAAAVSQTSRVEVRVADQIGFSPASEAGSTVPVTVYRERSRGVEIVTVIPNG